MRSIVALVFVCLVGSGLGCTNFLFTPGSTVDNSTIITYNADAHILYGALMHWNHETHPVGSKRTIKEWITNITLGEIPEVAETYNVVGNINEHQVAIGETTYEGLESLQHQDGAIMDYGSMIYIALQRSKTAREAITTMTTLAETYGYYSQGESFSVSDPNEAWIFELIGKGQGEKGAVWVARKIPDGYVCGHANQARITTFPQNGDPDTMYAEDVVSFAVKKGLYPASKPAEEFSFSDVYNPITPSTARECDGRVWSMFRQVTSGMDDYLDYIQGRNLSHRFPLWVKPDKKISLNDTFHFMRDHYENSWLDFRGDVGAGPFGAPYRWRPMEWQVKGKTYLNERATATQQTGWTMVAQSRSNLPDPVGGILWFGVDDAATVVRVPLFCSITHAPPTWAYGDEAAIMKFSFNSAFWVFNMVSNYAYSRWNIIYPDVLAKIQEYETRYIADVANYGSQAKDLIDQGKTAEAVELLTTYSVGAAEKLTTDWLTFWQYLFTRYMDGNVKTINPKSILPDVSQPGYGQAWYERIVAETGDHYLLPDSRVARPASLGQPTHIGLK